MKRDTHSRHHDIKRAIRSSATRGGPGSRVAPAARALRLDRRFIYLGSPDQSRWRDLRIWAVIVTVPYLLIYLLV